MPAPEGFGRNYGNTLVKVVHAKMPRVGDSAYRSLCPVCQTGHLMVSRNRTSFRLLRADSCTFCCQGFIYQDEKIADEPLDPLPDNFAEKYYTVTRSAPWPAAAK
jgi:hypothetical protein